VVNGRTEERVKAAGEKIRANNHAPDVRGVAADLDPAAGVDAFVKQVSPCRHPDQ